MASIWDMMNTYKNQMTNSNPGITWDPNAKNNPGISTPSGFGAIGTQSTPFVSSTYKAPTQEKVLTGNSGGGNYGGYNSKDEWYRATSGDKTGTASAGWNGPTLPGYEGVGQGDIDAIYNPLIGQAGERYKALEGQLPGYLEQIGSQGEIQKQPFDTRLTEGTQDLGKQEEATRNAEQSAISQARKLFNELNQYNLARFGSGTSTGQAAMELLGRSTSGNIGQATDTAQKNVATIKDNLLKLQNFVTQQKSNIDKEVSSKKEEAKRWFSDKLQAINDNKAALESEKAGARYKALADRTAYINSLNATKYNYEQELYNWRIQRQDELGSALSSSSAANPTPTGTQEIDNQKLSMNTNAPRIGGMSDNYQPTSLGQNTAYKNPASRKFVNGQWMTFDPTTGTYVPEVSTVSSGYYG